MLSTSPIFARGMRLIVISNGHNRSTQRVRGLL